MENSFFQQPFFGLTVTVAAYTAASFLHKRWRFLHPVFVCSVVIILFLLSFHIPYEDYKRGADLLALFLGPATVALGVPFYKNAHVIKQHWKRVLFSVLAGAMTGIAASAAIVGLLGGSTQIILSMMPKSASSPIGVEISSRLGGIPELTAVLTALTGLFGSMFGSRFLRWIGVRDDISIGIAIGAAAHGIGTAKVLKDSETQGSFSGLSMAICGVLTSILFIPIYWWLGC